MQLVRVPDKVDVIGWNTKALCRILPIPLDQMKETLIPCYSFFDKDIVIHMRSGYLELKTRLGRLPKKNATKKITISIILGLT